jgi:biopolymer transport protein ExbD
MTIRPAIKIVLIDVGLVVFAIFACVAIMQVHLRHAYERANAANNMASAIKEIQTRPQRNLYVQVLDDGSLY